MTDAPVGSARRPLVWSVVGQILPAVITYGTFIVLARFISPKDLGSVTIAALWVALWAVVGDLGLGVSLLREDVLRSGQAEAAFRLTVLLGVGLAVAASACAAILSSFGIGREFVALAVVASVRLVTDGFAYIPTVVCQRRFRFRFLALRDLVAAAAAAIIAVSAAAAGAGRWSLIIAPLVSGLATAAFYRRALAPRPQRRSIDWESLRTLLPFARRMTLQQFFKFVTQGADSAVVGSLLGPSSLGLYRLGQRVAIESTAPIRLGIGAFLLPSLADKKDQAGTQQELTRILHLSLVFLAPWYLFVASTADRLIPFVFGQEWAPAGPVVQILCVAGALQLLFLPAGEAMKAAGRATWLIAWTAALTATLLVAIAIGSRAGINGAAWGVVLSYVLFVPLGLVLMRRSGGPSPGVLLRACSGALAALAVLMALLLVVRLTGATSTAPGLALTLCVAAPVYTGGLWLFDRPLIGRLVGGVRSGRPRTIHQ